MLQPESKAKLVGRTFILTLDVEEDVSSDVLANRISDALYWVEGVGEVDVFEATEADDTNEVTEDVG